MRSKMIDKLKFSAGRIWSKWIDFLIFAREHRIVLNPKDWWKGIACLLIGWGLLAITGVIFKEPLDSMGYRINFLVQFIVGVTAIILYRVVYKILKPKKLGPYRFLRISHENERSGAAILDPKARSALIFARGSIGAIGYIGFQLARVAVGSVDNSIIYGADSLMYVILAMALLKDRYNLREWSGIVIIILGIAVVVVFDLMSMNKVLAIKGCLLGLSSSLSLAIILILTSTIAQHDHPARVTFYQCFYGILVSIAFILPSISWFVRFDFFNFDFTRAIVESLLYVVAVICFLQAFYYIDPIIMAISSYSLDLYSIAFSRLIIGELPNIQTIMSSILIAVGSGILIRAEYMKEQKKKSFGSGPGNSPG